LKPWAAALPTISAISAGPVAIMTTSGSAPRIFSTAASWLPAWALGVVWTSWALASNLTPLALVHSATPAAESPP
jgi:hypothetical protein